MLRDDSVLYTGSNSVTDRPTLRQVQKDKDEKDRVVLEPAAEVIAKEIQAEIAKTLDLRTFTIDRKSTEVEVNTELIARKLYVNYLNALDTKIKTALAKVPEATDE
jgi:hypothetical protein